MHPIYKYNLNVSYVSFVQTTISVIILIKIKLKFLFHFISIFKQVPLRLHGNSYDFLVASIQRSKFNLLQFSNTLNVNNTNLV